MKDLQFIIVCWVPILWMMALSKGAPPFLTSMLALTAFISAVYWATQPSKKS